MENFKIPATMATQHPDSASRYVPIQEEADEAVNALTPQPEGLGIEEIMIDFEGKMTPYHQTAEVAQKLIEKNLTPGVDVFITPRISNATEETVFRQLMALMSIIEADYDILRSKSDGCIKEIVLPMVKGADDLVNLRVRIADILDLAHKEFGLAKDPNSIQVIPLVETVPTMLEFSDFYQEYYKKASSLSFKLERMRFMIGRSDSALTYGLIPSVLACKIVLSKTFELEQVLSAENAPIIGGGVLPFRGHIRPDNIDNIIDDFKGVRTLTIQSGLRYDWDIDETKKFISDLKIKLRRESKTVLDNKQTERIKDLICIFSAGYCQEFGKIAGVASKISDLLPKQRDRLTRKSSYGYARASSSPDELVKFTKNHNIIELLRSVKTKSFELLPRAITFTGAMYSIGLPPEFLGLGQGLDNAKKIFSKDVVEELTELYVGLRDDLKFAARYLNLKTAEKFIGKEFTDQLKKNIDMAEKMLDIELFDINDTSHATLTEIAEPLIRNALKGEKISDEDETLLKTCFTRMGKLRGSLG
jgi:phosphoenolpyruvate carboxylase